MNYRILSNKVFGFTSNISGLLSFANWNTRFEIGQRTSPGLFSKIKNTFKKFNSKKITKYILTAVIAFVIVFAVVRIAKSFTGGRDQRTELEKPKALQEINRGFEFPLRNDAGEEVGKLKYVIEKAEKRDEIIVQGKTATAVKGRTFLIITLKINNDLDRSIQINTRDYMRLSVNGDQSAWSAPDIHNDPVEVQAISTKSTRLGFPINDSDYDLILRVGEIDGEKKTIELTL